MRTVPQLVKKFPTFYATQTKQPATFPVVNHINPVQQTLPSYFYNIDLNNCPPSIYNYVFKMGSFPTLYLLKPSVNVRTLLLHGGSVSKQYLLNKPHMNDANFKLMGIFRK